MFSKVSTFSFAILALALPAFPAGAQSLLREERQALQLPVDERIPEDFRPQGISYKGFIIRPEITASSRYDSNIYAENSNEASDVIVTIKPGVSLLKLFNAHTFVAGASANIERFTRKSEENKEEFDSFLRGRFYLGDGWAAPFGLTVNRAARNYSSPRLGSRTDEPVFITNLSAQAGISKQFNRLNVALIGSHSITENENGLSAISGAPVIHSDNDRHSYSAEARLRYGLTRNRDGEDEHILYASYRLENVDYERRNHDGTGFFGISRDNIEQGFLAGFETDYKGLIFANVGAGYFWREYDDPALDGTEHVDLTADIAWNIIPKLTLSFSADRSSEQNNDFLNGYVQTSYLVGLDYELLHNLYVNGDLSYTAYDFSDNQAITNREESDYLGFLRLRYLHSPKLTSEVELSHQIRESNISQNEFDRTLLLLRLTGKL